MMSDGGAARVGTRFGPYLLQSLLGRGGMGEVYTAYDTRKDRTVALKLLPADLAADPAYQDRFRREARTAARLHEPHIIPIHDFGEIDGVLYIDMRLVNGRDLKSVLQSGGALHPEYAVRIVAQIAAALDAAHVDGLVHRDIKPANILVMPSGFAYLADFGIAGRREDGRMTEDGGAFGSLSYMAPERFDNVRATARSDVYSLTCVLYECLTGAKAFTGDSTAAQIRAHLSGPPPVPVHDAGAPAAFDSVVHRGLSRAPEQRFATAGSLARAAEEALRASGSVYRPRPAADTLPPATGGSARLPQTPRTPQQHRAAPPRRQPAPAVAARDASTLWWIAAAAVLVAAAVVVLWVLFGNAT